MAERENQPFRLVPIERAGSVRDSSFQLDEAAKAVCTATVFLYEVAGWVSPWLGYLAVCGDRVVGTCAFKGPPAYGRVEIAYFTFPEFQRRGIATSMIREMVSLAKTADPGIIITTQTLAEPNVSTHILEKLGFLQRGTVIHPEDGEVWEWELRP